MVLKDRNEIVAAFDEFRNELDEMNDRRERIIKLSREVTIQSKRVIFLLHRLVNQDSDQSSSEPKALAAAEEKLLHIRETLVSQLLDEMSTPSIYWQHQRSVTPGVQEYTEAVSYYHYLAKDQLITHEEMIKWLTPKAKEPAFMTLPYGEFLLGLSDLTGELMRFAITSIARGDGRSKAQKTCEFVRKCRADFERFTPFVWGLSKKQYVTNQSVQKIEEANYALSIRMAEYDQPELLDEIVRRSLITRTHKAGDFAEDDLIEETEN
ncbi:Translin [Serendipita vermifera]|nr:Translin [Serendipita vermifera]